MIKVYYSKLGPNQEMDDPDSVLPGYFPYLSLSFKIIATIMILQLSGWVVYTIKATASLHKPYNIFVANVLVSDMVAALLIFTIQCSMMISYQLGVESFISCFAYRFVVLGPLLVNSFTIVTLASKVVVIVLPSMHKSMKTRHVITAIVSAAWLLAVIFATYLIKFDVDDILSVSEYGVCVFKQNDYIGALYVSIPMAVVSFLTMILFIMLIIKALKAQTKAEKLSRIDSETAEFIIPKTKLLSSKQKRKLISILLVVIMIPHLFLPLFFLGRFLIDSLAYQQLIAYFVLSNMTYVIQFFHSLVFGLYFKQLHQPIVEHLKSSKYDDKH